MFSIKFKAKIKSWGLIFLLLVFVSTLFQPFVANAVELSTKDSSVVSTDSKTSEMVESSISTDLRNGEFNTLQPHLISGEWQNQFLVGENVASPESSKDKMQTDLYSGAATYNYDFNFPAGRNGLGVDLSLIYNSQNLQSASAFGYGWELSGILSIQRNLSDGVDTLYSNKRFVFSNGGDLVAVALTDDVHGEYLLNIDNGDYLRFFYYLNNSWKIVDKQGTSYFLGATADSKEAGSSGVAVWKINKIEDKNGNFVLFSYDNQNGVAWPSKITYTHYGTEEPLYEVRFSYASRNNYQEHYRLGFKQLFDRKIKNIQLFVGGVAQRDFQFVLQEEAATLLLISIARRAFNPINTSWETLPLTNFEYNLPVANNWQMQNYGQVDFSLDYYNGLELLDLNSDGYDDAAISNDFTYDSGTIQNERKSFLNNKNNGFFGNNSAWYLPVPLFNKRQNGYNFFTDYNIFDLNGDSYPDLAKNNSVYLFNKNTQRWNLNSNYHWFDYWLYDNNVAIETAGNQDFNGDGLTDYVHFLNKRVYLNKWASNQNNLVYGWTSLPVTILQSDYRNKGWKLMDVNGDGLGDMIKAQETTYNNSGEKGVYVNKGDGQWLPEMTRWLAPLYFCRQSSLLGNCLDQKVLVLDINNDGLGDFLDSTGNFYINNGHTWIWDTRWSLPISLLANNEWTTFRFAEANGVPGVDLWKSNGPLSNNLYALNVYHNPSPHLYLLKKVRNENYGEISIEYEGSAKFNNNQGPSFSVVKRVSVNDGLGQAQVEDYTYEGSFYYFDSIWQRWRSGFGKIEKTMGASRKEKYFFHQGNGDNYPFEINDQVQKRGKLYYWEVWDNNTPLRGNLNVWQVSEGPIKHYLLLSIKDFIFYFDGSYPSPSSSILLSKDYNSLTGNLTRSIDWGLVTYQNRHEFTDLRSDDNRFEYFTYASDKSRELRSAVSSRKVMNASNQLLLQENFEYDNLSLGQISKGLLSKHSLLNNNNLWLSESFTYNNYGLNIKFTDYNGNVYTYLYDNYNYFTAKITNPLGHIQENKYNYNCGILSEQKLANGGIEFDSYDGFCRLKQKGRKYGNQTEIIQDLVYDQSFPASVYQKDYLSAGIYGESKTYYDGLGRTILKFKKQDQNLWSGISFQYNNRGFLAKQSLPFASLNSNWPTFAANNWETYNYDALNRLVSWSNEQENVSIAYTSFDKRFLYLNGQLWGNYQFDTRNNSIKITLNNGQVYQYDYDLLGRVLKMTDSKSNIRRFTYDLLGQPLSQEDWHQINDNSFGTWKYKWDGNGNLLEKTEPSGVKILYQYDRLNRLIQEDDLGTINLDYQYLYDGSTFGIGNLTGIKNRDFSIDYTYDWRSFLIGESYAINNFLYSYNYARNYQGQATLIVYPDQSNLEYVYNNQGFLLKADYVNGNVVKSVIKNRSYNQFGAVMNETLGNQSYRYFEYDKYGTMTSERVEKNNQILWKQDYSYDQSKNLQSLRISGSLLPSYQSLFTYDSSNRLRSYDIYDAQNQRLANGSFTYNDLNSLVSGDQRNYQYESNLASFTNAYAPIASTGLGKNWQGEYDLSGNLKKLGPYEFFWDANHRLRVLNYDNGQKTKYYYYLPDGQRFMSLRDNGTKQIWLNNYYKDDALASEEFIYGALWRQKISNQETFYYQYYDKFNNLALVLNENANLENYFVYKPNGEIVVQSKNQDSGHFYHQQWRDSKEENLDYKGSRYYSSEWQHYLSPDPVHYDFSLLSWEEQQQVLVNPIRLNPYIYLAHNPYQNDDSTNAIWETAFDLVSFAFSIKEFINNPTWLNGLSATWDLASVLVPFVPAVGQGLNKLTRAMLTKWSDLSTKYQNEIKKTAQYLNQKASDVWRAMQKQLGKIDSKMGRIINKYWRKGKFGSSEINFVEHYIKHRGELGKFNINSMEDYLNFSSNFINVSDDKVITAWGQFYRVIDNRGANLFFNPHNKLMVVLGSDSKGQFVYSAYEVAVGDKLNWLMDTVVGKAFYWVLNCFVKGFNHLINLPVILKFAIIQ
jgi:RHS repeat-associated protein